MPDLPLTVRLSPADNIVVARVDILPNTDLSGEDVRTAGRVPAGHKVATRPIAAGEAVDVTMGHLNWIWQGDANELILRSLALARPAGRALNLTGPVASVRQLAQRLGELLGQPAHITGREADSALISNTAPLVESLGAPPTPLETVLRWTAGWVRQGGRQLDKPTHFEVRDGKY